MTPEQAQQLIHGELSKRARVWHVVLLIGALAMGSIVASVWATEPALPVRTHLAFLALVVIAAGWTTHAVWVLNHRAVLLVPHRVQAARLALVCSLVFLAGGVAAWVLSDVAAARWATLSGVVMVLIAGVHLRRTSARDAALRQRRDALVTAQSGGR